MDNASINCIKANLSDEKDANDVLFLLDAYSRDPMGGGSPLSEYTRDNLIKELVKRDYAHVFIARMNGEPVGLITSFEGLSSFAAKPLLNLHDIAVLPAYRGKGIAQIMLQEIENFAKSIGCCKLTLEVLQGNTIAQKAYTKFGFEGYQLADGLGYAMFWQKKL